MKKAIEVLQRYLDAVDNLVGEELDKDEINILKVDYMTRKQEEIYKCICLLEREDSK